MTDASLNPRLPGSSRRGQRAADPLRALRGARRRHRLADIHWSDSLYRVYVLVVGVGMIVWWLASTLGTRHISAASQVDVIRKGPAVFGLVVAVLLAMAARSGTRGGPLAVESADLTHLLNAPVDRRRVLTRPLVHQFRRGLLVGAIAGGIAGRLGMPFLPGQPIAWVGTDALVGALLGVAWFGLAATVSGRRVGVVAANLSALAVIAWSVVDVSSDRLTSPLSFAGVWPLSPLHRAGLATRSPVWIGAAIVVAIAVVVVVGALRFVGGVSLERVERRAALVGQLRFAVSTQDLRAVLLLRRQLTSEHSRRVPWFRVKGRPGPNAAVVVRGVRSVARWPIGRCVRVLLCAVLAGFATRAAWEGAVPLVGVAGLLAFVAGLDAAEPLSQDADHPDRLALLPRHRGRMANRQVIVPIVVLSLFGLVGAVAGVLGGPLLGGRSVAIGPALLGGALVALIGAACGALGASVSVAMGPPSLASMLTAPELAFGRSMIAPALPIIGIAAPILWSRSTAHAAKHASAAPGLVRGAIVAVLLCYAALTYLTDGGVRDINRV